MIVLAGLLAHEAETGGAPTGFGVPSLLVLVVGVGAITVFTARLRALRATTRERSDGHDGQRNQRP